jgi:hypothetical protein
VAVYSIIFSADTPGRTRAKDSDYQQTVKWFNKMCQFAPWYKVHVGRLLEDEDAYEGRFAALESSVSITPSRTHLMTGLHSL